jgi:hypothetical protein
MSKPIDNKSGNLKEILMAIAEGKAVQFFFSDVWCDFKEGNAAPYVKTMLKKQWRVKPDAFEEAWANINDECRPRPISKGYFKLGWDAAMEHKDDG